MLRNLSASLFLLVMSLLVALHSPAIGYCAGSESHFVGDHAEISEVCEHDCGGHDHSGDPEDPGEHEHLMLSLDAGDFQWSAASLWLVPQFAEIALPVWLVAPVLVTGDDFQMGVLPANPPPPETPIFRRDAALRI